ncbi:uncharacterized protein C6orf118-like [Hypomesus transpacificus]|uniref:uncharacterized protein C6orf118-like n=1 Tax=Hypomesus transpacificus TaxID=137520 RepID=UPI001F082C1E|nr:uncharacterized protein C6orf118-like [Hypomesus transpacificus]
MSSSPASPLLRGPHTRGQLQALLLAAETAHKADILTYSSGHLGPHSLAQHQPHPSTPIWATSERVEGPQPSSPQTPGGQQVQTQADRMKGALCEFTLATTLLKHGRTEPETDDPPMASLTDTLTTQGKQSGPQTVVDTWELFLVRPAALGQTQAAPGESPGIQDHFWRTQSYLAGVTKRDQLKMMRQFDRLVVGRQGLQGRGCVAGSQAADRHARRLARELAKLPDQSWPSRERLRVFGDVFDDVCNGSPVFGDILGEIKTEYDLYVTSLLDAQSAPNSSVLAPLEALEEGGIEGAAELQEACQEVSRLGEEARRALEENDRVREEFRLSRDGLMGIPEGKGAGSRVEAATPQAEACVGPLDRVQPHRRQVWDTWQEVQQLETEIRDTMVSTITTSAIERCIRDTKAEVMRLLASSDRYRTTNKELEGHISMVMTQAGVSQDETA